MDYTYWLKQDPYKPLFPDIEWSRPERRDLAGRLGIIGGNKLGFAAVADAYQTATEMGVGHARVLLPDCLKPAVPPTITDVIFAACTPSGSLGADSKAEISALAEWSDALLLIGDASRSSETAVLYEQFIKDYEGPLTVTRDAIDLVHNDPGLLINRTDTVIVASFAQLQKTFRGVYYPKMLAFSMQLMQLVDTLHKFTVTYPCTIVTLHADTLVIAHAGNIVTQAWDQPMAIWRGQTATRAAAYWLWNLHDPLKAIATSLHSSSNY